MSVWTVLDICKEMNDVTSLLAVRMPFASSNVDGYMAMAGAMTSSICNKIQSIKPLTAAQAVELYKATSGMQLCDELKASLTKAIDEGVSYQTGPTTSSSSLVPQSHIYMFNYMTKQDWATINGPECTYWTAINVVATRLRLVGVKSLKEETKKWCTAMLVHCFMQKSGQMPPYKMVYQLSQDLQQAHSSCITQTAASLSCPLKYPEKPHMMGQSWMEIAYSASDPPVEVQLDNLGNLYKFHTPIRETSKLLLDDASHSSQKVPSSSDDGSMQQIANCLSEFSKIVTTGFHNHSLQMLPSPQQSLQILPQPKPMLPLTLPPVASASPQEADSELASTAQQFKPSPRLRLSLAMPSASSSSHEATTMGCGNDGADAVATHPKQHMSLEEYERASFEELAKKRQRKNDNVMKRPAASKAASASGNTKNDGNTELALGCPRCRGSINGCSTCRSAAYNGLRLHGKSAWEAHVKAQKLKQHSSAK